MKKCSVLILALLLIPVLCFSWSDSPESNVIPILTGSTIAANGTSTYIIDLNSAQFTYRPTGEMSIQFKGFTHDPAGGATINAAWRGANTLPTGVTTVGLLPRYQVPTSHMASTDIVTNLAVTTGNREYVYGFFTIDATRYILIDITSGVSNLGVTAYVKVD